MKTIVIALLTAAALPAQPKAPVASNPVVEFKGKIARAQIAPGQGMPYIEVESGGKTSRVFLGSMRYLMEQDFSPKAGSTAEVKGYKVNDDVVAISVAVDGGKALKFRDESGWPVWMGGWRGKGWGKGGGRKGWRTGAK